MTEETHGEYETRQARLTAENNGSSAMWSGRFWQGAGERTIKTGAQTLVALIGTEAVGVTSLDWPQMLSVAATAMLLSVLTSIGNADFTAGR